MYIKKLNLTISIILILYTLTVSASNVGLQVNLMVFENDSITSNVKVTISRFNDYENSTGDYMLEIVDAGNSTLWSKNYDLRFILLTNPPIHSNYELISETIPFYSKMYELRFYHNNKLLLKKYLDFCDNNNVCDLNENALSCPTDCATFANDGICLGLKDDYCDPDCLTQFDPDCISLNKRKTVLNILLMLLIFSVSALISAIYIEKEKFKPLLLKLKHLINSLFYKIKQHKLYSLYKKLIYVLRGNKKQP